MYLLFRRNQVVNNVQQFLFQVHIESERYTCDSCPKTFVYKDDLKRHTLNIHLKATNRQCEFCGKEFQEDRGLRRHRRLIHKQTV